MMGTVILSREKMACSNAPTLLADTHLRVQNENTHPTSQFPPKKQMATWWFQSLNIYISRNKVTLVHNQRNQGIVNNYCFEEFTKCLPRAQYMGLTNSTHAPIGCTKESFQKDFWPMNAITTGTWLLQNSCEMVLGFSMTKAQKTFPSMVKLSQGPRPPSGAVPNPRAAKAV